MSKITLPTMAVPAGRVWSYVAQFSCVLQLEYFLLERSMGLSGKDCWREGIGELVVRDSVWDSDLVPKHNMQARVRSKYLEWI
jgi:hypothetical protein